MLITLLSAGLLMGAYFLLLYAGVGLIQDKRFFSSISPLSAALAWVCTLF